jgi:DNA-binding CsgD family transcriptional regulator
VLAPTVATRLVSRMRTPAEVEVLELVARGSSNAGIAAALLISEATVKTHLLHVFAKLGVDDRTAAVVQALERGIIALPVGPVERGFDQHCAVAPGFPGPTTSRWKGSGVTQSDVSTSGGESETTRSTSSTSSTRSGRAERNAAAAADLDRSRGSFSTAPAAAVQLAEIQEVDPGTVFQGAGFPDWLAANLEQLAKELGLSGLREVGRDVGVGSYTADILAQTDRGRRVAIMSHLEPSDHLHLGQMITFAAGLEVSAVIWISSRIGEEHRAVLDWLNQHGDDDVRFFGIELRLLRVGNSPPGVSFHVESRPNDWQKVVRQRQRVGSPLNSRTREF